MSYSFATRKGTADTVVIPVSADLTGATLSVEFSQRRDFTLVALTKAGTAIDGNVNVSLTAADVDHLGDGFYRVKATKDGASRFIQDGSIEYYSQALGAGLSGPITVTDNPTGTLVKTVQDRIREDFAGTSLDANMWEVTTGPGMTVAVASSELRVTTGTTVNSTTTIRSKKSWNGAYRAMFVSGANLLSQRIANQDFELRVVNAAGTSFAAWAFSGTVATTQQLRAGNNGTSLTDITQTSTQSTISAGIYELENFIDEVYYHSRAADSSAGRATSAVRNRQTPDPTEPMFIEIRVRNLATAPASSTTLTLDAVLIQDISELTTEITGGRGGGSASQSIPVTVVGTPTTTVSNTIPVANTSTSAQLSVTNLTSSGTYTQTAVDLAAVVSAYPTRIRPVVMHLAGQTPGTLRLEESTDGTTYRETWRVPVPSDGLYHSFDIPLHYRYYRLVFNNGVTAQTGFFIGASTYRGDGATDIDKVLTFPLTTVAGQALGSGITFTSPTFDLGGNHMWDRFRVLASADQASAAGGFYIQQSLDGTNWFGAGVGSAVTTLTANGGFLVESPIAARFLRCQVVNSTTAMTALKVSASLVSL